MALSANSDRFFVTTSRGQVSAKSFRQSRGLLFFWLSLILNIASHKFLILRAPTEIKCENLYYVQYSAAKFSLLVSENISMDCKMPPKQKNSQFF